MGEKRDSKAEAASLITDKDEEAAKEAENAIRQFDAVLDQIDEVERDNRPFRLRVSKIQYLHRLALEGLSIYAGNWRPGKVEIAHSKHNPPAAHLVAELMEELCDWVNENWEERTAIELSAYVMWRLNWIHPFDDGNGRTSRAVSYLVLCAKTQSRLPGRITIPELIARNREPYYQALENIDGSLKDGEAKLGPMIKLLEDCLAEQLMKAYEAATENEAAERGERTFH